MIKGNVTGNDERIFRMKIKKIRMDKAGGKWWFCTPEELEAAGWRRAVK